MKKTVMGLCLIGSLAGLLSACGDDSASSQPKVASGYQSGIDNAWKTASEGKSPLTACAVVAGRAVGMASSNQGKKSDAAQAFEACYVDVFARYVQVFLDQQKNDDAKKCFPLLTGYMIHKSALGGFAADVGLDRQTLDTKVIDRVGDAATICPDVFQQ